MSQRSNYVFEGRITAEQPLATCSKDLLDREGGKNKPVPVPHTQTAQGPRLMFPATGLRGTLRRRVRDVVRQRVIEITGKDKPFDLDTHYMLTLGGIKGSGEEDKTSVLRIQEVRDSNPLLNLFGAGDAGTVGFMSGRLSVGNAICDEASEPAIFSGARADDLYRDPDQLAFMGDADLMNLADRSKGNRARSQLKAQRSQLTRDYYTAKAEQASNNRLDAIQSQMAEVDAEMDRIKAETGSDNSVSMPLAGWQAIPVGARMSHR
ncbi:hypothetical protein ACGTN6_20620, partial [Halomonas sp. THAF12]|uniref:hypothetical protein n=1 Tax=Halomonas sp. B23F22_10 TaxID=3459515 RepID=UPI00373E8324